MVSLRIPSSKVYDFGIEYFKLFNDKGERPDQFGDRGPEYRNLIGLPGGRDSPLMKELLRATLDAGDKVTLRTAPLEYTARHETDSPHLSLSLSLSLSHTHTHTHSLRDLHTKGTRESERGHGASPGAWGPLRPASIIPR